MYVLFFLSSLLFDPESHYQTSSKAKWCEPGAGWVLVGRIHMQFILPGQFQYSSLRFWESYELSKLFILVIPRFLKAGYLLYSIEGSLFPTQHNIPSQGVGRFLLSSTSSLSWLVPPLIAQVWTLQRTVTAVLCSVYSSALQGAVFLCNKTYIRTLARLIATNRVSARLGYSTCLDWAWYSNLPQPFLCRFMYKMSPTASL